MDGVSDNKISKAWKCNITSRNEQISLIEYIISEDIAIDLDDMRMGWQFFQKILIIPVNHILKIYRDLAEKLRKIWNLGPASYLASAHKDSSDGASAKKKSHPWMRVKRNISYQSVLKIKKFLFDVFLEDDKSMFNSNSDQ